MNLDIKIDPKLIDEATQKLLKELEDKNRRLEHQVNRLKNQVNKFKERERFYDNIQSRLEALRSLAADVLDLYEERGL